MNNTNPNTPLRPIVPELRARITDLEKEVESLHHLLAQAMEDLSDLRHQIGVERPPKAAEDQEPWMGMTAKAAQAYMNDSRNL